MIAALQLVSWAMAISFGLCLTGALLIRAKREVVSMAAGMFIIPITCCVSTLAFAGPLL